jgi:hypothetical protein
MHACEGPKLECGTPKSTSMPKVKIISKVQKKNGSSHILPSDIKCSIFLSNNKKLTML